MLERVRPELGEERQCHRAELVDCEVRDRRLRPLRQQHPDPVAGLDPHRRQRICAAVGEALQIIEREPLDLAVRGLVDQREPAAAVGVSVACRNTDIEALRQFPPEPAIDRVIVLAALDHRAPPVPIRTSYHR